MHFDTIVSTVHRIIKTAETAGGKIPKLVTTDLDRLIKTAATVRRLDVSANLPAAVFDTVQAGRDPATDPAVRDAVIRRALGGTTAGFAQEIDLRAAAFLEDHAPTLLDALRTPFDQAAAALEAAFDALGDMDLADTSAVLAQGGDAARVWADAQEAETLISRIQEAWGTMSLAARSMRIDTQFRVLTIADIPAGVFIDENLRSTTMSGWDVVRRGWPLSLATPDELAERIQAVQDERVRRNNAGPEALAAHQRRTHPPIAVGSR